MKAFDITFRIVLYHIIFYIISDSFFADFLQFFRNQTRPAPCLLFGKVNSDMYLASPTKQIIATSVKILNVGAVGKLVLQSTASLWQ